MKHITTISLLLLTLLCATACLGSGNDETTLYDDAAIVSFSVETLKCYGHTTSSTGEDSTYTATVTVLNYAFTIDQVGHRIFNRDSLPLGTDVSHVVCNITTRNNGTVLIRDVASDTLRYYFSTDSINFTTPRKFVILSNDGSGRTEYTISVNAHQENPDKFVWTKVEGATEPEPENQYGLPMDGISRIIGSSSTETYALSDANQLMVWHQGGSQWEEDVLDDDPSLIPTEDLSMVCYPMNLSAQTDYVLLAGNRSAALYPQETPARVWRKLVDYGSLTQKRPWVYMERPANALYQLPRLGNLQLVKYDDGVLAFGSPYTTIYQSRDNGITWKNNSMYQMPEGFDANATSVHVRVDDNNYIWLYCQGTGQVWRGCLNRLRK